MARLSLFQDSEDLEFLGEVDAAMRYKGSKWAYRLSFICLGGFVLFMIWICFTERNEVTRGTGQITPSLGVFSPSRANRAA